VKKALNIYGNPAVITIIWIAACSALTHDVMGVSYPEDISISQHRSPEPLHAPIWPCNEDEPVFEYTMRIFPKTVSPGDSIFLHLYVTNIRKQDSRNVGPRDTSHFVFTISIDGIPGEYRVVSERCTDDIIGDRFDGYDFVHRAGETWVLMSYKAVIPPLDDWEQPFWQQARSRLEVENLACKIRFASWQYSIFIHDFPNQECSFTLTQRPLEETQMIKRWYCSTPPGMFPIPALEYYSKRKNKNIVHPPQKVLRAEFGKSGKNFITIQDKRYSPRRILQSSFRLPGDPNCPETWEGWKELEELLEPSTMRDEIRLTRMMIQYCDTEDPAVLDELTEWFSGMNEIQRAVMAENVRWLPGNFSDKDFYESMIKIRETLRPFAPAMTTTLSHI
jgi:hypothetical protein